MPVADKSEPHGRPVLRATQARQGLRGRHVLWILVISLGLIVIIYAVMVGGLWGGRLSQPGGQTRAGQGEAQLFNAPPPQPRESENPQTTPTITPNSGTPNSGAGQGR
jgi:hypothetical protein